MHVRSLFAVVVAALVAGPAAAHAAQQAKKSSQTQQAAAPAKTAPAAAAPAPQLSLGGWIGYEMGDLDGLQLRVDGVLPFRKLSPQLELSFVGSIGYSYLTHSVTVGVPGFETKTDTTANILKFVPAARFTLPVNPQLSFFGDAGLGLYWAHLSVESDYGFGTQSVSDSSVGFMFRFGLGGFYKLNPKTQLGLSIYLDPMLGDYDDATFSVLAGALFQL